MHDREAHLVRATHRLRMPSHGLPTVQDMESLGLSAEDLNPSGPLNSRRALARAQSAQIMSKKFIERDRVKQRMMQDEARIKQQKANARKRKETKWNQITKNSPFNVNLVAESERLEEEFNIRLGEESKRQGHVDRRQELAKQEIILRALQEESDLEALRREKRAIMEEERRLKVRRLGRLRSLCLGRPLLGGPQRTDLGTCACVGVGM